MAKKRPKWASNVAHVMKKKWTCPDPCMAKWSGLERNTEGKVIRTWDCHDCCPLNKYRNVR